MRLKAAMLGGFVFLALGSGDTLAQDQYPSRTVKLVVPTSPGAVTDIIARALGQALSQSWGQPFVVDNRPGGDETLGIEATAKSPPDGYTLVLSSNGGITAAPHLQHSHPVRFAKGPHPDLHARPGNAGDGRAILLIGAISPGSYRSRQVEAWRTQLRLVRHRFLLSCRHGGLQATDRYADDAPSVPGAAPAYTALLRNETAVMIANLSGATGHAEAGHCQDHRRGRSVSVENAARSPDGRGIRRPGFATGAWWGLFGPANLPRPIIDKIRAEVARLLGTPEMQKVFAANTMELVEMTQNTSRGLSATIWRIGANRSRRPASSLTEPITRLRLSTTFWSVSWNSISKAAPS